MIFKNGRLFHTLSIKKESNKSSKMIFKNGRLFSKLGFEKIPVTGIVGYAQKILSITATSVSRIIGVARTSIEKVIGVD